MSAVVADAEVAHLNGIWSSSSRTFTGKWNFAATPHTFGDFSYNLKPHAPLSTQAVCLHCNGPFQSSERHVSCVSCSSAVHNKCNVSNETSSVSFTCKTCLEISAKYPSCPPRHRDYTGFFFLKAGKKDPVKDEFSLTYDYSTPESNGEVSRKIASIVGQGSNEFGFFRIQGSLSMKTNFNGYDIHLAKTYVPGVPSTTAPVVVVVANTSATAVEGGVVAAATTATTSASSPPEKPNHTLTTTTLPATTNTALLPSSPAYLSSGSSSAGTSPKPSLVRTSKQANIITQDDVKRQRRKSNVVAVAAKPPPQHVSVSASSPPSLPKSVVASSPILSHVAVAAAPASTKAPLLVIVSFLESLESCVGQLQVLDQLIAKRNGDWENFLSLANANENIPLVICHRLMQDFSLLKNVSTRSAISAACELADAVCRGNSLSMGLSLLPFHHLKLDAVLGHYLHSKHNRVVGVLQIVPKTHVPDLIQERVSRLIFLSMVDEKVTLSELDTTMALLQSSEFFVIALYTNSKAEITLRASKLIVERLSKLNKPLIVLVQDTHDVHLLVEMGSCLQVCMCQRLKVEPKVKSRQPPPLPLIPIVTEVKIPPPQNRAMIAPTPSKYNAPPTPAVVVAHNPPPSQSLARMPTSQLLPSPEFPSSSGSSFMTNSLPPKPTPQPQPPLQQVPSTKQPTVLPPFQVAPPTNKSFVPLQSVKPPSSSSNPPFVQPSPSSQAMFRIPEVLPNLNRTLTVPQTTTTVVNLADNNDGEDDDEEEEEEEEEEAPTLVSAPPPPPPAPATEEDGWGLVKDEDSGEADNYDYLVT